MSARPSDLRAVPLFQGITDDHLAELTQAFEHRELGAGVVLFEAGSLAEHLLVLVRGEVALEQAGETRFRLTPIAPIGELGAVMGIRRNTTAVTTQPSEVWQIGTAELRDFFEKHGDVAFPLYHNLLSVVTDKVRRDTRRLDEMRANLIRTQKAMKRLLELVLSSEEMPLSKQMCETLEDLIQHNRRWHYRVEPAHTLTSAVRLDGGLLTEVSEISEDRLRIRLLPADRLGTHMSFVLITPGREIPLSGTVEAFSEDGALIKLDLLIDEYAAALQEYLTRLQMLDFVV